MSLYEAFCMWNDCLNDGRKSYWFANLSGMDRMLVRIGIPSIFD